MLLQRQGRGQFLTSPICPGSLLQHKAAFWTRFRPLICIIFCCIHTFFENILQNTTLDNHILCCVPTYFENILQNTTLDDHIFFNTDTFVRKHNAKHYSKYHIICYMTHFGILCPGSLLQHKAAFWTRFRPLICIIFCCIHTFFENILQNTTLDNHILCCVPTYFENILQNTTLDDHIFFNTDTFVRKHNAKHYSKYHIICYMTHFGIWERSKTDPSAKHTAKRLNT